MRTAFLVILFFFSSAQSMADYILLPPDEDASSKGKSRASINENKTPSPGWEPFGYNDEFTIFMHTSSVVKNKSGADVWMLTSHPEFQTDVSGKSYKSNKTLYRLDCKKRTSRVMHTTNFYGENGYGKSISSFGESAAFPIIPDSIADDMLKTLCPKNTK